MRILLAGIIVLLLSLTGKAQNAVAELVANDTQLAIASPLFYKDEIKAAYTANPPGAKMKRTGKFLTIFGGALLVGGIALASTADELYYSSNTTYTNNGTYQDQQGDPQGGLGVVMAVGGIGMMVPGIIFWSKGSKKYNEYKSKESVSMNLKGAGLSLNWRF